MNYAYRLVFGCWDIDVSTNIKIIKGVIPFSEVVRVSSNEVMVYPSKQLEKHLSYTDMVKHINSVALAIEVRGVKLAYASVKVSWAKTRGASMEIVGKVANEGRAKKYMQPSNPMTYWFWKEWRHSAIYPIVSMQRRYLMTPNHYTF